MDRFLTKVLRTIQTQILRTVLHCGGVIPDFLLQYEETDWIFLIHLASSFSIISVSIIRLVMEGPILAAPIIGDEVVLREEEYDITKNPDQYNRVNVNGELLNSGSY